MRRRSFDRGRWRVERERHQLTDENPASRTSETRIDNVVAGLLRRLGVADSVWLRELEESWPRLVGGPIAAHTRPGRYDKGVLTIYVDSSVWLSELSRFSQKELLQRLQSAFTRERIRAVRLQMDPEGKRGGMGRPGA